jgi:hypothetical protein
MMSLRPLLFLAALSVVPACALERRPIPPPFDEDTGVDAALDDVPSDGGQDVPDLGPPDVPLPDVPLDVPADVPLDVPPDVPTDAPFCAAAEAACDGNDEDCDGLIDDGICDGCTALEVGGRVYQSCPATTGFAAWTGTCRTNAPGYEVAVFQTETERGMVADELGALGLGDHWIGLNEFDAAGTYQWFDRAVRAPTVLGSNVRGSCVRMQPDGTYVETACTASHRVLCERLAPPGACGSEGTSCDGADEDCDGRVDEGLGCGHGCTSRTFWDRVYYACTAEDIYVDVLASCRDAMGASLTSFSSPTEHYFVTGVAPADTWIALTQGAGASSLTGGWSWGDGGTYGQPFTRGVEPWATDEPNDFPSTAEDHEEDCAIAREADGLFNDVRCDVSADFVCERAWRY